MTPAATLALIVRSQPFGRRTARADVDVALAVAALDIELHVYFLGAAVLQLLEQREAAPAGLPPGHRAWAALPELGKVRVFAESEWLDRCAGRKLQLMLPAEGLDTRQMREGWRRCRQAIVL